MLILSIFNQNLGFDEKVCNFEHYREVQTIKNQLIDIDLIMKIFFWWPCKSCPLQAYVSIKQRCASNLYFKSFLFDEIKGKTERTEDWISILKFIHLIISNWLLKNRWRFKKNFFLFFQEFLDGGWRQDLAERNEKVFGSLDLIKMLQNFFWIVFAGRHDTQHNDIYPDNTQHYETLSKTTFGILTLSITKNETWRSA